jgi:hypothetical protein
MGDVVCCCGIDNVPGFENFWKYQASQAAKIAKEKGFVKLEDLKEYWHGEKTFGIHNTMLREEYNAIYGKVASTPKFAVDYMWNKGGEMSPECMISMKRSQRNNELVYEWSNPIPLLESKESRQIGLL